MFKHFCLVTLLISLGFAQVYAQDACPVTDTKNWDRFAGDRENKGPAMSVINGMGYLEVFFFLEEQGVSFFWNFAIEPNTDVAFINLTTTKGAYRSEVVFFSSPAPSFKVMNGPLASSDYMTKKVNGEIRVVAFAKFPSAPQGDVVSWSVEP